MTIKEFKDWLEKNKGKQFSVKFFKRDGSLREMKCLYGVQEGLIKNPYNPGLDFKAHDLICVWSIGDEQYKSFREGSITEVLLPEHFGWEVITR